MERAEPSVLSGLLEYLVAEKKADYIQELQKVCKELQLLRIVVTGIHLTSATEQSQLAMQLWYRDYGPGTAVPKEESPDGKV
jgi:hypothetical protein